MQLNSLKARTKRATKKQVGRGGKRGKTSGRGHKGQKQHGGHGIRPQLRDEIKRLPKLRGRGVNYNTPVSEKAVGMSLATLEQNFKKGERVTPQALYKKGLVLKKGDKYPRIKILASGEVTKSFTVSGCATSASAKEKIEKAGGSVQ